MIDTNPLVYFAYTGNQSSGSYRALFENNGGSFSLTSESVIYVTLPESVKDYVWYHMSGNETDGYTYTKCSDSKHHNLDICDSESHAQSTYLLYCKDKIMDTKTFSFKTNLMLINGILATKSMKAYEK